MPISVAMRRSAGMPADKFARQNAYLKKEKFRTFLLIRIISSIFYYKFWGEKKKRKHTLHTPHTPHTHTTHTPHTHSHKTLFSTSSCLRVLPNYCMFDFDCTWLWGRFKLKGTISDKKNLQITCEIKKNTKKKSHKFDGKGLFIRFHSVSTDSCFSPWEKFP